MSPSPRCVASLPPTPTTNAAAATGSAKKTQPTASQVRRLCKQGRLDRARRLLLESLPRPPPTLLCNVLLIAYVARALPDDALRLYALLNHAARPAPRSDHYTYSSVLTACARTRRLRLGRAVHAHLLRRSRALPDTAVLRNSLLNLYASCLRYSGGGVDVVRRLFDAMPKRNAVSWNTLFGWYVKTGRPHEALELFARMLEDGVRPTPVSFVNVFPAAANDDPRWPFVLYGLLVKHGTEYVNDLFVVSSAISMFSELGDVQSAWRVFEHTAKKNTEVWNTMITGYVQNGKFIEAIDLFIQMLRSKKVPLDVVTFLSALTAASQSQDGRLGQQLHGYLIKGLRGTLPVILGNALVVMYSRCGNVQTAFELFDRLPEKDIVSWNTMITAFVQNEFDLEGLLLVYQMQKSGFAADSVTLTAVLSAASNTGDLQIGIQAHGYLIRHGIESEGLESYLIDMYAKSCRIEIAQRVFDGFGTDDERDEVTWNAMIAGYTQSGQSVKAILVFREMLEAGLEPTSVTLASVLPACDPLGGGIFAGKQIHCFAVRRCLNTNVFVGTALVDMYSKCGEISTAEHVFAGMTDKSTVSYTTMISGLGQHGFGKKALSLFYSMREKGLKPDAVTFLAAISACNYSGLVDEGLALFRSMETFGIAATPQHHCCVVDMLGKAGRVEEAYDFVEELGEKSNFISIWGSLLASCKTLGKQELAKLVTERLLCIEKKYGHAGYNVLLSHVFTAESNWSSADSLRKEMRLRGLRKVAGSSWIKVQDAALQNYPKNDHMYSMLHGVNYSSD
ncbi:hypothetical protein QOZ80_4AG0304970 [Eleusine coracana subsp. coracana]|nr:hypothetical protein QOZ80_4AG0304970 [Eleusine coracana subsp. coracana]